MRRRTAGRRRRVRMTRHASGLSLTSLMDILTCLLFFVLKSFVAGGEATVPPPGLDLPRSVADQPMASSLVVAIDHEAILVGSDRVTTVRDAEASPGLLIEPLAQRLEAARAQMDDIARQRGGKAPESRAVTLQGDQDIEFHTLQKVMFTLQQGGFQDIALAVIKKA